ncbi:hypothetical protein V5799_022071 [Amblyomma americanum]|uniref:Uncharacterized protein n=1 Tax=Amblyomma americanum TaxID=6943 RepID=A0AAQ4FN26_AMBAM
MKPICDKRTISDVTDWRDFNEPKTTSGVPKGPSFFSPAIVSGRKVIALAVLISNARSRYASTVTARKGHRHSDALVYVLH